MADSRDLRESLLSGKGDAAAEGAPEPESAPPPAPDTWSWPAQFLFYYMYPVLRVGAAKGSLAFNDIPELGPSEEPRAVAADFMTRYARGDSVLGRMHATHACRFWYSGALLLLSTVSALFVPIIIQALLDVMQSDDAPSRGMEAYLLALAMFGVSAGQCLTIHRFWWESTRVGMLSQLALTSATFAKTLQLSSRARASTSRGRMMNHMSIDACRLNDYFVFPMLHWASWSAALTVGVTIYNLFAIMGLAGVVGAAGMTVLVPLSTVLIALIKGNIKEVQKRRDTRGKLITEALAGIQTLKVYGWVDWFAAKIFEARDLEMIYSRRKQNLAVWADFAATATPLVILAGTFALYAYLNPSKQLTAATAFATTAWITGMQFPLRLVPITLATLVEANMSMKRLRHYFSMEDADVVGMTQWEEVKRVKGDENRIAPLMSAFIAPGTSAHVDTHVHRSQRVLDPSVPAIEVRDAVLGWWVSTVDTPAPPAAAAATVTSTIKSLNTSAAPASATAEGIPEDVAALLADVEVPESAADDDEPANASSHEFDSGLAADDDVDLPAPTLRTVTRALSFQCRAGSVTLVCGPVGAGKSTLLSALIGDAYRISGSMCVRGSIAYVSQSSWVLNRTLRENIVFTSAYRPNWFERVSRACALDVDASSLKHGYDTLIGDAGVTLSGGQKQRASLARAVYADADVYILDDVLSAVDAVVGAHIWTACIVDLLIRRGKTVICATHATHFAARPEVSQVIVLSDTGSIAACGPYATVASTLHGDKSPPTSPALRATSSGSGTDGGARSPPAPASLNIGAGDIIDVAAEPTASMTTSELVGIVPVPGLEDASEVYAKGSVQLKHVWRYLRAFGNSATLTMLLSLYILTQLITIAINWFMTQWVMSYPSSTAAATSAELASPAPIITGQSPLWYAAVYAGLNGGLAVVGVARMLMLSNGAVRAGTTLHNAALTGVMRAPARFFSVNPSGRILNRFLSDMTTIDDTIRTSISNLATQVFNLIGVLAVVAYATPYVLLCVLLLAALYTHLANLYRISARDLRRMQSTAKSPILSGFSELLRGVPIVRAFGPHVAHSFLERHLRLCRNHARAFLAYWSANEFISTWLEGIGTLVILCAVMFAVWQQRRGAVSTADVGFTMNVVLQLPSVLMWLIRNWSMVEVDAVSVERLAEYMDLEGEEIACAVKPAAEKLASTDGDVLAHTLAHSGEGKVASASEGGVAVDLRDVQLSYAPNLPRVLAGVNMHIPPGAKVAICGRTGGGKSTLVMALSRMYAYQGGSIHIAGDDVGTMTCTDTRSRFCMLLQDSWMCTGTIRENLLGPAAEDAVANVAPLLADVLRRVGMQDRVSRLPHGLDSNVEEGGGNFSVGERALLSLARALLRQAMRPSARGLLVADEPTASVDPVTDALVHHTLLSAPCTVVCICHRLAYVPRFDLVAVINRGRCVEIGPPRDLLRTPDSQFAALYASTQSAAAGSNGKGNSKSASRSAAGLA